jgi:signal transduction histidine kinase
MLFRTDPFPLMTTIKDAARMFEIDAIRKKIEFEIIEGPGIPETVYGDSSKIRQVRLFIISPI